MRRSDLRNIELGQMRLCASGWIIVVVGLGLLVLEGWWLAGQTRKKRHRHRQEGQKSFLNNEQSD